MPTVFIKREDGDAFFSVTDQGKTPGEGTSEGGGKLKPDDIVDGRAVKDWPVGVFTVQEVSSAPSN